MNDQLDALVEKYKISEEQTRKIFKRFILPELKFFTPSGAPTGVIVGAQPGAGKSHVLNLITELTQRFGFVRGCYVDFF